MRLVSGPLLCSALCLRPMPSRPAVHMDAIGDASTFLADYDAKHRAVASQPDATGLGGGISANEWAVTVEREPLSKAVRALRLAAMPQNGRIMLGICADDAAQGLSTLKAWVGGLHLPRGVLHGMDKDGVPLDMSDFGAVYIKYNSLASDSGDPPGTATLSGYGGDCDGPADSNADGMLSITVLINAHALAYSIFCVTTTCARAAVRGVYFNPDLQDGEFRQYAVLPLDLFGDSTARGSRAEPPTEGVEQIATLAQAPVRPSNLSASQINASKASTPTAAPAVAASAPLANEPHMPASVPLVPNRFSSRGQRFISRPVCAEVAATERPRATLHRQGWVQLHSVHNVPSSTIARIRACRFEPIFNGQTEGTTPLRLQARDPAWAGEIEAVLHAALEAEGMLLCSDGSSKQVNDCYALRSLPCAETPAESTAHAEGGAEAEAVAAAVLGRQPAHSDAPEPPESSVSELADVDVPLSAMLAVEDATVLWVYPAGCDALDEAQLIQIARGDVIVWRGDLVHAGAGYAVDHVRVHAYIDPPAHIYERPRGKTNRCEATGSN